MTNNAPAINSFTDHLHMIYSLASNLNGAYGSESIQTLMRLYGETFNHITTEVLPEMGLSEEAIEDIVAGVAGQDGPYLFRPSIVAV